MLALSFFVPRADVARRRRSIVPPGRPFTQDGPAREASVITAKYNCHTETLIKIGGWQKQALWNDNGSWINGSEYN